MLARPAIQWEDGRVRYLAAKQVDTPDRYLADKTLDSTDLTGWTVRDSAVGFRAVYPPHLSRLEAIQAAERLNQEAGRGSHEGGSRMVEIRG